MKPQKQRFSYFVLCLLLGVFSQICAAQDDGVIRTLSEDNGGLPPGAVYENGSVSHPITSAEENLHLLAGYYFRNPREWKRIYNDNRDVIGNPNNLPVGQTLKIHVGEHWKPLFSYEEWFSLANRNGQWKSGQTWQPVRSSSGVRPAPSAEPESKPVPAPPKPAPAPPKPAPAPKVEAPEEAPSPPVEAEPEASKEPQKEESPPPPLEDTPEPEDAEEEEEAAPAF